MTDQPTFLTKEGMKKLEEELRNLQTVRRHEVADRLHAAMEEGDIDENAEYDDAKNEQAFVEGRILMLENMFKNTALIDESVKAGDEVLLGCKVTIVEGTGTPEVYHLVGVVEADPTKGKISNESPLGKALMGRRVGDTVQVNAPAGLLTFRIVSTR